jgi:integrase
MDLRVALRHAVSRISTNENDRAPVRITFAGTLEIQGEGPRRRRIGPVDVSPDDARAFLAAVWQGDETKGAEEFEHAFAISYGVTSLRITDVSQLDIAV